MGEQSPSSREDLSLQRPLGIERLDAAQREMFQRFVEGAMPWLVSRHEAEAAAVDAGQAWESQPIDIEQLARSSNAERAYAASAIAEYAEASQSDEAYRIWERLVGDPDDDVAEPAGHFLLSAIGRRNLDLPRLLPVLRAYQAADSRRFERQRRQGW